MTITIPTGTGNVTTNGVNPATSIAIAKPANVVDNDTLVAAIFFRDDGDVITPPSGWTQVGPLNTTFETFAMYVKPIPSAAAEVATSYTFSTSGASLRTAGVICRIPGLILAGLFDAAGALAAYTQYTSTSLPAVTAVSTYTILLGMAITNNAVASPSVYTAPAGMTTIGQASATTGAATSNVWLGAEILSASGSSGVRVPTISPTASNSGGFMVTLKGIIVAPPAATVVPDQIVSATGWTLPDVNYLGDASDLTYAESAALVSGSDQTLRVGFPALIPSPGGIDTTIRLALVDSGGTPIVLTTTSTAKLYQGATLIKSWGIAPGLLDTIHVTASSAEVAAITDWSALELQIAARL